MELENLEEYKKCLKELKNKFRLAQINTVVIVNKEMLKFYWNLGKDIVEKQENFKWGESFFSNLSKDLTKEFPHIKGFSITNLKYMKRWYLFWNDFLNRQQGIDDLENTIFLIHWTQNIMIFTKCKTQDEALFYVLGILKNGWSKNVLAIQIDSNLYGRQGKAISNFSATLPNPHSDFAQEITKDPYCLEFIEAKDTLTERDVENQLVNHISKFLLELGQGFAYMGRQVKLTVSEKDFYIDLLFYHTKLKCYVVIELKNSDFEPSYVGQLNFYVKVVDEQRRGEGDNPTIGLLLCRDKDKLIAEYALSDVNKPIGISAFNLRESLPEVIKSNFPSVEELEAELKEIEDLE